MLRFGMKPPISFEKLLEICGESITDKNNPTLKKWRSFDTTARNALVKIRAGRKHVEGTRYLRPDGADDPKIALTAMNAYKNPSILASEKTLDEEKWKFLDELESGHFFDIDLLIIYAQKLMILEKWEKAEKADKPRLLEEAII